MSLEQWLGKARKAGLDDESIEALFLATFRSAVNAATDQETA
jgi:GntR family transcriptional regulator